MTIDKISLGQFEIFGLRGALDESQKLVERAKDLLDTFGDKADNLRQIADYIVNRKE